MAYAKVLIAVDSLPQAELIAQKGIELAQSLTAEVALVHVIDPAQGLGNVDAGILPAQAQASLQQLGQRLLETITERYGRSLNLESFLVSGKPATKILWLAQEWSADILVIGTHKHSGQRRFLRGSIVESIIHHAPCPVFLI